MTMDPLRTNTKTIFVTFYSYKGGVGRTMSLLNSACILAGRGRRVLLIDFDLEAPGLTTLRDVAPAPGEHRLGAGLVELIYDFLQAPASSPLTDQKDKGRFRECYTSPIDIPEHLNRLSGGCLDLMPCGKLDEEYGQRLNSIKFDKLYQEGVGQPLFKLLKNVIQESALYDYVLIDSRTGLSDESGICTRDLADHIFVITGLNRQNVDGTVRFLKKLTQSGWKEGQVIFVASPVPVFYEELRDERIAVAQSAFGQVGYKTDFRLKIPYHPRLALDEEPFIYHWTGTDLFSAYELIQRELRQLARDVPSTWRREAREAVKQGKFGMALHWLRRLGIETPDVATSLLETIVDDLINTVPGLRAAADPFLDLWLEITDNDTEVLDRYANILLDRGEYVAAEEKLILAVEGAKKANDAFVDAYVELTIGDFLFYRGKFDEALASYHNALNIFRELGPSNSVIDCLNRIGILGTSRGEYDAAKSSFLDAIGIAERENNLKSATIIRCNLANLYNETGDYGQSLVIFQESLRFIEDMGDKGTAASIAQDLGRTRVLSGDPKNGLQTIEQSFKDLEDFGRFETLSEARIDYSEALLHLGDAYSAINYLDHYWNFIQHKATADICADALTLRAKIKAKLGDGKGAAEDARSAITFYHSQGIHTTIAREAEQLVNMA